MSFPKLGLALAIGLFWSCAAAPMHAPPLPVRPVATACSTQSTTPCPVAPDPRTRGLPKGADTALWVAMDSLLEADFAPSGGVVGAYVARLSDSTALWQKNPDTRMLPASTQKVYTAVAGVSLLGSQFRWRTTLWRTGSVHGAELKGDLVLEGGGDPTLGAESGALSIFVGALKKQGIETVTGNLVALDTVAGRNLEAWPGGWTVASAKDGYGAPVVGLNWNQNRIGDRAVLEPRREALKALRASLLAKGITVKGTDTTVRVRGDSLTSRRSFTRVASVASPALEQVLRTCLRESVNPFAESVILGLGLWRRGPAREAGLRRIREWLQKQGMDPEKMVVDDGSGLSRYDLTTARQMSQFLARDARNDGILLRLLARGGEGTLRKRFALFGDPSQVLAKTGTLDGVANLTGYLVRPTDTLVFTFLCSGYSGQTRPVRELHDRWLARLQGLPLVRPDTLLDSGTVDISRPMGPPTGWADSAKFRPRFPPPLVTPPPPPAKSGPEQAPAQDTLLPPPLPDSAVSQTTDPVPPPPGALAPPDTATHPYGQPTLPAAMPAVPPPVVAPDTTSRAPVRDSSQTKPRATPMVPVESPPTLDQSIIDNFDPLDSFPRPFDPDKIQ